MVEQTQPPETRACRKASNMLAKVVEHGIYEVVDSYACSSNGDLQKEAVNTYTICRQPPATTIALRRIG